MQYTTSEKKKESSDHKNVKNYLELQRNKRAGNQKQRNHAGGYVSNFTNYDDLKSESAQSYMTKSKSNRPVGDAGLRKLLADPAITDSERINAVKLRTE